LAGSHGFLGFLAWVAGLAGKLQSASAAVVPFAVVVPFVEQGFDRLAGLVVLGKLVGAGEWLAEPAAQGPFAAVVAEGSLAVVAEGMAFCHPLACILLVQGS
jgi:hypothetical protein